MEGVGCGATRHEEEISDEIAVDLKYGPKYQKYMYLIHKSVRTYQKYYVYTDLPKVR
jgi:hypothetical protein